MFQGLRRQRRVALCYDESCWMRETIPADQQSFAYSEVPCRTHEIDVNSQLGAIIQIGRNTCRKIKIARHLLRH